MDSICAVKYQSFTELKFWNENNKISTTRHIRGRWSIKMKQTLEVLQCPVSCPMFKAPIRIKPDAHDYFECPPKEAQWIPENTRCPFLVAHKFVIQKAFNLSVNFRSQSTERKNACDICSNLFLQSVTCIGHVSSTSTFEYIPQATDYTLCYICRTDICAESPLET